MFAQTDQRTPCFTGGTHKGHPPACPTWGGVKLDPCSSRSEPPSVRSVRADCGGRLFTAKFGVVVHNLSRQLLN